MADFYDRIAFSSPTLDSLAAQREELMASLSQNKEALQAAPTGGLNAGQGLASALIGILPTLLAGLSGGSQAAVAAAPSALAGAEMFNKFTREGNVQEVAKQKELARLNTSLANTLTSQQAGLTKAGFQGEVSQRNKDVGAETSIRNADKLLPLRQAGLDISRDRLDTDIAQNAESRSQKTLNEDNVEPLRELYKSGFREANVRRKEQGLEPLDESLVDRILQPGVDKKGAEESLQNRLGLNTKAINGIVSDTAAENKQNGASGNLQVGEYPALASFAQGQGVKEPSDKEKAAWSKVQIASDRAIAPLERMQGIIAERAKAGKGDVALVGNDARDLAQAFAEAVLELKSESNFNLGAAFSPSEQKLLEDAFGPKPTADSVSGALGLISNKARDIKGFSTTVQHLKDGLIQKKINTAINNGYLPFKPGETPNYRYQIPALNSLYGKLGDKDIDMGQLKSMLSEYGLDPRLNAISSSERNKLLETDIPVKGKMIKFKAAPLRLQREVIDYKYPGVE